MFMLIFFTGETSGTTATFVIIDGWTVTVASVGDSRCILDTQGGAVSALTVDHRLEENVEEYVSFSNPLISSFRLHRANWLIDFWG